MITAIKQVHRGRIYLPDGLWEPMLRESMAGNGGGPGAILTRRECQVLRGLARGLTVDELAERLFISEKTVSTHRANLMRKLGLRNNVALTHFAIRHGYLVLPPHYNRTPRRIREGEA
jgi:DNA-binding NarL/FixJ family response regulator